jgi:hypothetical protein
VRGSACVSGAARVCGSAYVYGSAYVTGSACVSNTTSCIHISNLCHDFTVTDNHIQIGCELKTKKEWLKITKKQALKLGLPATEYSKFKALVKIFSLEST